MSPATIVGKEATCGNDVHQRFSCSALGAVSPKSTGETVRSARGDKGGPKFDINSPRCTICFFFVWNAFLPYYFYQFLIFFSLLPFHGVMF